MWWEERAGWVRSLGKWFESGRLLEPASVEILGGFSDSPWSQTLLAEINRLLIVQEASRIWGEDSWKWYPVAVECFSRVLQFPLNNPLLHIQCSTCSVCIIYNRLGKTVIHLYMA